MLKFKKITKAIRRKKIDNDTYHRNYENKGSDINNNNHDLLFLAKYSKIQHEK